MKFFTIIEGGEVHLASDKKVLPAETFTKLVTAEELLDKVQKDAELYRLKIAEECEVLKELAEAAGFDAGLQKFADQIALLEQEIVNIREETENALVPLAITAVKKIIGKELELKGATITDIVATALKNVSHHRKITIYVNQRDLEYVETEKPRLKALFEHLESLSVSTREDIDPGGCIIETELGIINAKLENQLHALEAAFRLFFQHRKDEKAK